ncbi:MAG TPA: Ig domain-containing protein [Candidatus Binatia bacterium]|nr:Ig domain-containing protein [Candidatus Binatia bacterium]
MHATSRFGKTNFHNTTASLVFSLISFAFLIFLTSLTTACSGASAQGSSPNSNSSSQAAQLKLSLPPAQATVGVPYNAVTSVSGGSGSYSFSISSGGLPPGLVLNSQTGSITGTPTTPGTYNFVTSVSSTSPEYAGAMVGREPVQFSHQPTVSASASAHITVSSKSGSGSLSISPNPANLISQAQQQFTAQLSGTADTAVSWSATEGTISASGLFTAPKVSSSTTVTVTATSTSNSTSHATATVTVNAPANLAINTSSLPAATAGTPYSSSLSASGGTTPYQWSVSAGALPSGLSLQAATGAITGTTVFSGSYPFTAKVTDAGGQSSTQAFTFTVSSGSASGYDGPAQLPLVYIQTAMADTPAPGNTISVNAGGDLQSALNSASCGDTIQLQQGATFTGVYTFPAKSCDSSHWIIVRTSASDSALPAEGSRLTPCYAGVSSLPGRPAFNCTSTKNVLAKLIMPNVGSGPIVFASGAGYYRLIGLEVTRPTGGGSVTALSSIASGGTAGNIILDRMWLHGTAHDDTTRGVDLGSSTYFSVIDSFFTDFHCVSITGACTDSQSISGGLGSFTMGPYKISDNFLEASGENMLFGGGAATVAPTDIEVTRNHFYKPLIWMQGQSGFVGGSNGNPFVVKNLFELKNAQRVLIDSNIMEYSWGGFSQVGFAILITPKNQSTGGGGNDCPSCEVTDVTIRYGTISHVAAGMQIANGLSDNGGIASAGERYSIHDIIVDDINGNSYNGPGELAQVSMGVGSPVLSSVTINHVTAFPPSTLFIVGDEVTPNPKMSNFIFTNSIVNAGAYPVWSSGSGGKANCAYHNSPATTFNACFSSYSMTSSAMIAVPSNSPTSSWPAGNFFPASATAVQFVNYNGGNGGDYHLQPTSPYKNAGSDGKDLGADVDAIDSAIAGVQ